MAELLRVNNLETQFKTADGLVRAVNGVSFSLNEGETLGIVGESGSGKSVTALSIMRLIPTPPGKIATGEVLFRGADLLKYNESQMRQVRGKEIAMIFQDPMTSLNPVLTISKQIGESLKLHMGMDDKAARKRTVELLKLVGIPSAEQRLDNYPHQFSGGMRQRVMIAMALSCNPNLLLADEPTTALDVTIQAQILELLRRLKDEFKMAMIFITHDLGVVAGLCDRVIVMYGGRIMEHATTLDLYTDPRHPYTLGLLNSVPRLDEERKERLVPIPGMPPDMINAPQGCPFYPRCTYREPRNRLEMPPLLGVKQGHDVACWIDVRTHPQHSIEDETAVQLGTGEFVLPAEEEAAMVEAGAIVGPDSSGPPPDVNR